MNQYTLRIENKHERVRTEGRVDVELPADKNPSRQTQVGVVQPAVTVVEVRTSMMAFRENEIFSSEVQFGYFR